jgi:hypothetical protein
MSASSAALLGGQRRWPIGFLDFRLTVAISIEDRFAIAFHEA